MGNKNTTRTWHGGKPIKTPAYDAGTTAKEISDAVTTVCKKSDNEKHPSMQTIVNADRQVVCRERKKACKKLQEAPDIDALWSAMVLFSGYEFKTRKGLVFTYKIKGGEMFVDRKEKSITKSTVEVAFTRVIELHGIVSGPKKLGVFGASYLYPVFQSIGIIK